MPDGIGQMVESKLIVGVVTGAHGVRGQLRVKSFTADPADLTAYGPLTDQTGDTVYKLTLKGEVKGQLIASLAGCTDRNAAEALRGTEFYLDRALLPQADEEEFYHADLIGMAALDGAGTHIGTVRAVFDFGSGDMLEVVGADGSVVLYPFTEAVVPEVDLDAGRLTILPPAEVEATQGEEEGEEA